MTVDFGADGFGALEVLGWGKWLFRADFKRPNVDLLLMALEL